MIAPFEAIKYCVIFFVHTIFTFKDERNILQVLKLGCMRYLSVVNLLRAVNYAWQAPSFENKTAVRAAKLSYALT